MQLRDALGSITGCRLCYFPTGTSRRSAVETPIGHRALRALENLSDRQAAERCGAVGLEIALSLPLDDQGVTPASLWTFACLLPMGRGSLAGTYFAGVPRTRWRNRRGQTRSIRPRVIANVRGLTSLRKVGESLESGPHRERRSGS